MKSLSLAILSPVFILSSLLSDAPARASGCMWYDEYEMGRPLATWTVAGTFGCRTLVGTTRQCWFRTIDPKLGGAFLAASYVTGDAPPSAPPTVVTITSFEAMHWNNCDGGDQTPAFERNGVYSSFDFEGVRYQQFTADTGH